MAFGIPLSQVIANDRAYKRRQDALKESRREGLDLEASILRFRAEKRQFFNGNKPQSLAGGGPCSPSANSVAPAPLGDAQNKPLSPTFLDNTGRQRRVRQVPFYCLLLVTLLHNLSNRASSRVGNVSAGGRRSQ